MQMQVPVAAEVAVEAGDTDMTKTQYDIELLRRVCNGNEQAMDFLANHWSPYVHQIDDIMDGDRPVKRDQLKTFALAAKLYAHPFYLANLPSLQMIALLVTATYADVVDWETSDDAWKRNWVDAYRHCGMDMVIAVALICGGIDHAFAISQEQRAVCWTEHHGKNGEPT